MRAKSIAVTLLLCGCAHQPRPADTGRGVPPTVTDAPAATSAPEPERASDFVVRFRPGETDLSPEAREILGRAAEAYGDSEVNVIVVSPGDAAGRPADNALTARRIEAVQAYLEEEMSVWSEPMVRDLQGELMPWSADGPVPALEIILVLGPPPPLPMLPVPPVSPTPPPAPPGDPSSPGTRPPRQLALAERAYQLSGAGPERMAAPPATLAAVTTWLTPTSTLTHRALEAMMGECLRTEGAVGAECAEAAAGGEGAFAGVPEEARREFAFLMRSCRGDMPASACIEAAAMERQFRAFPRGELKPEPLEMIEDERTLFKAPLVDSGERRGAAGFAVDAREAAGAAAGTAAGASPIILPYSSEMCFTLDADPRDFRIEPPARVCLKQQPTGASTVYRPEWWVTPLRAGRLGLRLKTELFVKGDRREFQHNPYPLPITVKPKPSFLDGLDALLDRLTGTVNRTTGLVKAIGALFTALAGWGIWAWLRKRRAGKGGARPRGSRRKKAGAASA